MMNDINHKTPEGVHPCSMALCVDNDHLLSSSGGKVSYYTMMNDIVRITILYEIPLYKKFKTNGHQLFLKCCVD